MTDLLAHSPYNLLVNLPLISRDKKMWANLIYKGFRIDLVENCFPFITTQNNMSWSLKSKKPTTQHTQIKCLGSYVM